MPNLNKVLLIGNLTRDPDLRQTPNGHTVCRIGLAINRTYTDNKGERQQDTTFVDAEAWGHAGETIHRYVNKGDPLFIEGRLRLDRWKDNDGANRSKLLIVVEGFQFLGSRPAPGAAPAKSNATEMAANAH
ncbi:MAG: single-stranded DNA-binding protein [Phycisphaeraceae bacterium]|nr:single-stranded DNA-binding protein [Phycisphaeraceae bacterium]